MHRLYLPSKRSSIADLREKLCCALTFLHNISSCPHFDNVHNFHLPLFFFPKVYSTKDPPRHPEVSPLKLRLSFEMMLIQKLVYLSNHVTDR